MSTHTSTVTARIEKARAATQARLAAPDYDWHAVICFYAALHWVGACYEQHTQHPPPGDHRSAKTIYGPPGKFLPDRIYRAYRDLQSFAEIARYELVDPFTKEESEETEETFRAVHNWALRTLGLPE